MRWKTVRLDEVAKWGSGGTPKRSVREYFGEGVPWLSIADLNDGIVTSAKESLTQQAIRDSSAKVVPPGTIFVAMYGSIGKLGIAGTRMCTSQAIAFAIPDEQRLDTRYFFHFLLAERPRLLQAGRGGTQMNIGQGDLKAWRMPLPPIEEQRRIADILDRADALRAKRCEALARLDDLSQSIFLDMFGDPMTNTKRWAITTVGDVADVQGGLQVSRARARSPIEVPYLRVANVHRERLELSEIKTLKATESEIARTSLQVGDLLVVEGHGNPDEIGRSALWDGSVPECVHQNHLIRVRFDRDRVNPRFGSVYLNSQAGRRHLLRAAKTTSGLNTISTSNVKQTPIGLPPPHHQEEFAGRLDVIRGAREKQRAQLFALESVFASLQHQAFSGQL